MANIPLIVELKPEFSFEVSLGGVIVDALRQRAATGPLAAGVFSHLALETLPLLGNVGARHGTANRPIAAGEVSEQLLPYLSELPVVSRLWENPVISPISTLLTANTGDCLVQAIGTEEDVVQRMSCRSVWNQGYRGQNVAIAICDTGVDRDKFPVIDGWAPDGAEPWGEEARTPAGYHGSMVAHAALLVAPDAKILDVGFLKQPNNDREAWLSNAIVGMNWIANWKAAHPEYRVVVNNSWSTYSRLPTDGQVGSYSSSREHPFNERLEVLCDGGMPIVFAAGNCGAPCPDLRCGVNDTGPNKSIWGAASLDDVLSVAAVDIYGNRLPYSSQGEGLIARTKPDLACYSQYKGYMPIDPGTSTASPIAAGCVALMISARPQISWQEILRVMRSTMFNGTPNWNIDIGAGIVHADKAVSSVLELG